MSKIILRKGGLGIKGTYRNIEHHAMPLYRMVHYLEGKITKLTEKPRIKSWFQGHNIHIITASDGRMFSFRGFQLEGKYAGITLSSRVSRSLEIPLYSALADNIDSWTHLIEILRRVSSPTINPNFDAYSPESAE